MQKEEIMQKLYSRVNELPTLPVVVPAILQLVEDEKSDAADVTEAIQRDPALTAKVLKVANSAYYGFSQQIADIDRAVSVLGFNMVKSLALSIGVMESLPVTKQSSHFSAEGLWVHSIAVASAMQELGSHVADREAKSQLFVIGILHDIGKILFNTFFPDEFRRAVASVKEGSVPLLHKAEEDAVGIDHAEAGAMLLKRWKFPAVIRRAIRHHHTDSIPDDMDGMELSLLRLANSLVQKLNMGETGNAETSEYLSIDMERTGVSMEMIEKATGRMESRRAEIEEFFRVIRAGAA